MWNDEVAQVGIASGSLSSAIQISLNGTEPTPALTQIICTLWYHIAPYGEKWLLLPCMLSVVLGIFVIGLIGEQIKDKKTGVLAVVFCTSASGVWTYQAFNFRAYPFVMLFATLTLYCYIKRNLYRKEKKWHILYSLFLLCMGMTHTFGMFICAAFFLADLRLFIKKQIGWKIVFDYFIPGFICTTWEVHQLFIGLIAWINAFDGWWSQKPNVTTIIALLHTLSGDNNILYFMLCLGILNGVFGAAYKKNNLFNWRFFYQSFLAWTIVIVIGIMTFYGVVIKPNDPMFNTRYFMILIPNAMILTAMVVSDIYDSFFDQLIILNQYRIITIICIATMLFSNCVSIISQRNTTQPYREAGDWLYRDINYIYNEDSLVIEYYGYIFLDGWNEYYLTKQGKRDAINIIDENSITEEILLNYNRIYVETCAGAPVHSNLQMILDKYYNLIIDDTNVKIRVYNKAQ